jgi:transcriptional regulator GlxA family with amidase domain
MDIAIPLFDRFTALDAIGPYETLSRLPGARVTFLAAEPGPVATDNRMLKIVAEAALSDMPSPDIVVVPGGIGSRAMMNDAQLIAWVRAAHATSEWTCSVCTGSLVLGAAGLLDGLEATTHWMAMDTLASTGARPSGRRVVEQGKIITAAGVSAGIDMGLTLAAKIAGDVVAQAIQLGIEYDPQPPFDAGSPEKAPEEVVAMCRSVEALVDAGQPV